MKWVDVPGYEELYQVSSCGKVCSKKTGRLKKVQINPQTFYCQVFLWKDNKQKTKAMHRLLYEAFVGEIPNGLIVRHLNDIRSDNRLENLAVGTHSDNRQDADRNGTLPKGENHSLAKLQEDEARRIKYNGENARVVAKELGVTEWTVYAIRSAKSWGHI